MNSRSRLDTGRRRHTEITTPMTAPEVLLTPRVAGARRRYLTSRPNGLTSERVSAVQVGVFTLPTHCCHRVATIRRLKAVVDQTSGLYLVPALGQPICAARRRLAFTTWR